MTGRLYTVDISAVAVSVVQDLFNFTATANMAIRPRRIELGQVTQSTWGALGVALAFNPATVTAGSGGSVGTVNKTRSTDAAATATARINDTTGQTTSGTQVQLMARAWELLNGFFWLATPDEMWTIPPSGGMALQLKNAPGSAITVSGVFEFEELF